MSNEQEDFGDLFNNIDDSYYVETRRRSQLNASTRSSIVPSQDGNSSNDEYHLGTEPKASQRKSNLPYDGGFFSYATPQEGFSSSETEEKVVYHHRVPRLKMSFAENSEIIKRIKQILMNACKFEHEEVTDKTPYYMKNNSKGIKEMVKELISTYAVINYSVYDLLEKFIVIAKLRPKRKDNFSRFIDSLRTKKYLDYGRALWVEKFYDVLRSINSSQLAKLKMLSENTVVISTSAKTKRKVAKPLVNESQQNRRASEIEAYNIEKSIVSQLNDVIILQNSEIKNIKDFTKPIEGSPFMKKIREIFSKDSNLYGIHKKQSLGFFTTTYSTGILEMMQTLYKADLNMDNSDNCLALLINIAKTRPIKSNDNSSFFNFTQDNSFLGLISRQGRYLWVDKFYNLLIKIGDLKNDNNLDEKTTKTIMNEFDQILSLQDEYIVNLIEQRKERNKCLRMGWQR